MKFLRFTNAAGDEVCVHPGSVVRLETPPAVNVTSDGQPVPNPPPSTRVYTAIHGNVHLDVIAGKKAGAIADEVEAALTEADGDL